VSTGSKIPLFQSGNPASGAGCLTSHQTKPPYARNECTPKPKRKKSKIKLHLKNPGTRLVFYEKPDPAKTEEHQKLNEFFFVPCFIY
jgi:hypothetical protein